MKLPRWAAYSIVPDGQLIVRINFWYFQMIFVRNFVFFSHKSQDLLFQLHHWWMRFRLDGFVLCVSSNPLPCAQSLDNISENCTLKCRNWSFSFQAVCSKYICQVLELDRPSCARFDELVFASPNFWRQIEFTLLVPYFSLHWLMCVWNTQDNFWLRSVFFLFKE